MPFSLSNKVTPGVILFLSATIFYFTTNHFPVFEPQLLPMNWVDLATPFIPQTAWIYSSEYFLYFLAYGLIRNKENFHKYFYAFFFLQVVSGLIFLFWPTTYPRDQFPLPETLDAATHWLFSTIRASDTPANCAPSLHVSTCYLTSFIFLNEQRKKFPFFFAWATLVGISTLTTKQHYLIDVVTGLALAAALYWIFNYCVTYRAPKARGTSSATGKPENR